MHEGRFIFAQVMEFLPKHEYDKCVLRYRGDYRRRSFSCYDQFLCMAFAQLSYRESLRDTVACLQSFKSALYHAGIRGNVSKSTLADANEKRDWRIYADFAQALIAQARRLYVDEDFGVELDNSVYALDSSVIDLCLSVFPWARFTKTKSAVKLHTLMNLRGNIPEFIHISDGTMYDARVLDLLIPEAGSIYVMDRGYLDFSRLYDLQRAAAFFVTRAKRNLKLTRRYSHRVDKTLGLRSDQTVTLAVPATHRRYPVPLRRISYRDPESGQRLVFLTNNFSLPAFSITQLYKARWQLELFFRWIKQHLRIKAFYGTSRNAVKTQIWIAVCVYVLVAIIKKKLGLEQSRYKILQILSLRLFDKTPLLQAFSEDHPGNQNDPSHNQLQMFDF